MSNFSIPQSMNPVRYQASLGGNVKSTNINNVHEQFQIELGIVKKVFYRKGTLLFSIINRRSSVSVVGNDTSSATASAPIPVETFGRNSDGKVFGGYRPVKVGSKIAVGYVNGERSAPIVLGVYPDNGESYEIVSPVSFETGEDSDKSVEDIALGSKEITASQNIIYQSGKGDILKTFNGKSLLYINANGSNYMDDINYAYDQIADTRDGNMNPVTPRETRAQSWLLVHEDNPENEETNGHRTRFYVNKNGEFQMVMFSPNNDSDNNLVVFTASKDDGFKLRKQFDTDDLDGSEQYVQFSIGSGNSAVLQSVDKDDASEISMLPNGLQLTTPNNGTMTFNGRSLESMFGSISSAVDAANAAGDKATTAASAGAIAQSAASDAASQALAASQAGEDAKIAAVDAQAAGEDAKAQAKDTRDRIIYYASISKEKDVAVPGKYIIVNTDTYIANGTIKTAHIGDGAITNAKIDNLAVNTAQIANGAITNAKIGNLAVGTAQIEDAAITDVKVGNLSADHLNAGTIDFSVISGIHINASEIDVGKIVADQIFVNGLGDISKNLGTVTSGDITGTNLNSDVATVTSEALAAQSKANAAKEAADSAYAYANSEIAVQSNATQNAQSKADSAFNQAQTAIDNNQTTNEEITKLRNGSTMTIADLENGLATKVANSDYASYKVQTASQIAQKVDNGAFSAYQQTTADLISSKVATKDFNTYTSQTANAISSKVESKDFNSYKTQTAGVIQTLVGKSPSNIIKDGGFNSAVVGKVPSGWTFNNTAQIVANPQSSNDLVALGHPVLQINSKTSGNSDVYYGDWFDVQPGDQFYTELKVRWSSISQKGTVIIGLETCDAKWGGLQWPGGGGTSSPNNWAEHTGIATVGANAAHARVWVSWQSSSAANEAVLVTDLVVRPAYATHSQFTQLSDDINLRVKKGDLIDQINLQAGNTLISSSGQLTLAADTIYFDTKKPVIIPSANITGTLTGKTINAGAINTNDNNTARLYPFTADSNGVLRSYHVNDYFANYARMYSGNIVISDRNMVATDGNKYSGETAVIGGASISLSSGYTVGKDTDFSKPLVADGDGTTQLILSGVTGIALNGSDQSVTFKGTSSNGTNGIRMDSYGNIHGEGTSGWWRVYDSSGSQVANFGTAPGNNITFPKPLFIDEIGGYSSNNSNALFIHGDDDGKSGSTGQMLFQKDGRSARVTSVSIYNRTYSSGSSVNVTSYGTLGRITSASKYKLDITKETSISPANKLLSIDMSSWIDKSSAESLADSKTNGTELSEPEINVNRHYGLIAEDLIKAGLDEFVIRGDKGQAEGIEYDRLWITLIPKIRDLSNNQINDRMTISRLEKEVERLKQEVKSK